MTAQAAPTPPAGAIHDLGYEPYSGPRTPRRRRFLVVARNVVAVAWRSRWGVKAPVLVTTLATIGAATVMALGHKVSDMTGLFSGGKPLLPTASVLYHATELYTFLGFLLATTVGCAAIADDMKTGAFQFYFSRPLGARDYVVGKLTGVCLVVGLPMAAGPILLSLFQLLLAEDASALVHSLPLVARATAAGLVGTLALAIPALGMGALVQRRTPAQALFAVYYLVVGGVAHDLGINLGQPLLRLLSLRDDLDAMTRALYGIDPRTNHPPSVILSALALVALSALGAWIVNSRVVKAETTGIGGGS